MKYLKGHIYVASNEAMPGYLKVGATTQDVKKRVSHLSNTSIPMRFNLEYSLEVDGCFHVEAMTHKILDEYRVPNKEFFKADIDTIIKAIESVGYIAPSADDDTCKRINVLVPETPAGEEIGFKLTSLRGRLNPIFIGKQLGCTPRSIPSMSNKPGEITVDMAQKIEMLHAEWIG